MSFTNRIANHINRRRIKVISQTPTEIIADIERADENVTNQGTLINAQTFLDMQAEIQSALDTVSNGIGTFTFVNGQKQTRVDFASDPQTQINGKLNATAQAVDSAKLGGKTESQLSVSNANTCSSSVNLTGNQTITGTKNFTGTLQHQGLNVLTILASSLSTNGYIKLSNNLKIQWGKLDYGSTSYDWEKTLTFPSSFSSTPYIAIANPLQDSGSGCMAYFTSLSSTGGTIQQRSKHYAGGQSRYVFWLAIGV